MSEEQARSNKERFVDWRHRAMSILHLPLSIQALLCSSDEQTGCNDRRSLISEGLDGPNRDGSCHSERERFPVPDPYGCGLQGDMKNAF